jgi:ABC-type antimicrobial peptide transport system permease subunit
VESLLAGIAAGCAGALALGNVLAAMLFKVRPTDPVVIASVVALVAGVGIAASAIAARQSLTINPAEALREE